MKTPRHLRVVVALSIALAAFAAVVPDADARKRPPRDRVPPAMPTIDGLEETDELRPFFTFHSRDNRTPPERILFRCALDNEPLRRCGYVFELRAPLAFGSHSIQVQAVDAAGNRSRTAVFRFVVFGSWDAGKEFARAPHQRNPGLDRYGNEAWLYMYSGARIHDPTLYRLLPLFRVVDDNRQHWDYGANDAHHPAVPLVGIVIHNSKINMHPMTDQFAILGWRSPYSGRIEVRASAETLDPRGSGVTWSLDQNGTTLFSEFLGGGRTGAATIQTNVAAGDVLYLIVDGGDRVDGDTVVAEFHARTLH